MRVRAKRRARARSMSRCACGTRRSGHGARLRARRARTGRVIDSSASEPARPAAASTPAPVAPTVRSCATPRDLHLRAAARRPAVRPRHELIRDSVRLVGRLAARDRAAYDRHRAVVRGPPVAPSAAPSAAPPSPAPPLRIRMFSDVEFMVGGAQLQTLGPELRAALALPEGVLVLQVPRARPRGRPGCARGTSSSARIALDVTRGGARACGVRRGAVVTRDHASAITRRDAPARTVTLRW